MKRAFLGGVLVLNLLVAAPVYADRGGRHRHQPSCDSYDNEDNGRNCNDDGTQGGGNGNKGRDGDTQRGDKNCHSFCGNTIIIPNPMESSTTTTGPGQKPSAAPNPACLIIVPHHCDPKPR